MSKNQKSKINNSRSIKQNILFFCCCLFFLNSNSQIKRPFFPIESVGSEICSTKADTTRFFLSISFGQTIPEKYTPTFTDSSYWYILENGVIYKEGIGASLSDFVFNFPGEYNVTIVNKSKKVFGGCNHPDQFFKLNVKVNSFNAELVYKEEYWYSLFSNQKTFKNYKIQVPIKITFYNNSFKTINLNELNLSLSGVNCNLWGKSGIFIINEDIKIVYIDFILNGTVGSGIYTMLDFIDNNGNGMSFSIMKPLK